MCLFIAGKSEAMIEQKGWANLPSHILVKIFTYLSKSDQFKAAQSCKAWSEIFSSPYLWTSFEFYFYDKPNQERVIKCLDNYGKYMKRILLQLDQSKEPNREDGCEVLKKLAELEQRRLQKLIISFTGENPFFYAGKEFLEVMLLFFGPPPENCKVINRLIDIDLGDSTVSYDDEFLNVLSANNPHIEKLNIQNQVLVCRVSPIGVLRLVGRCRKLKVLRLHNCSLSEDILLALTEDERSPLETLAIMCRREEKYIKDVGGDIWKVLTNKLPNLRVTLLFDHTCPLHKVSEVMKPEVPIRELRLETFTYIYDEINMAASYYKRTLEKVVINTPMSRNSPEFNLALVALATKCTKLNSLHVFCVVDKDTVDKIFALHPDMYERKSYTLKYEDAPHPWIAGKDC